MTDRYLRGRAALVTGGGTGLGRAIGLALATAGADVAIGSLPDSAQETVMDIEDVVLPSESELEQVATDIEAIGVNALALPLDVRSNASVQAFYDTTIGRFGKVDILVNAAGVGGVHHMVDHPDELWDQIIDTNLSGMYRTIKRCLPGMIERRWGRIINIASSYAHIGSPSDAAYCAAKAGVLGLTRSVALEGAPHGVTCNSISPSWARTGMATQAARRQLETGATAHLVEDAQDMSTEDLLDAIAANYPQGRLVEPEEIGALAAYLCREEALGITMEDIRVSAGSLW